MGVLGFEPADRTHRTGDCAWLCPQPHRTRTQALNLWCPGPPQVCPGVGAERPYQESTGPVGQSKTQSQAERGAWVSQGGVRK